MVISLVRAKVNGLRACCDGCRSDLRIGNAGRGFRCLCNSCEVVVGNIGVYRSVGENDIDLWDAPLLLNDSPGTGVVDGLEAGVGISSLQMESGDVAQGDADDNRAIFCGLVFRLVLLFRRAPV